MVAESGVLLYYHSMCGIAGMVRFNGNVDQRELDVLTDRLEHRGPDGRGSCVHGSVGLGQRRLKIIDLTEAAAQPMFSDDGMIALVFNGELYSFQDERKLLEAKGYRFRSTGDTEVLLKLYEEYGVDCLSRLRGMFAFAIHDRRKNLVFLARDRVGKKPIVYFRTKDTFAFASELKALKSLPDCPRKIDEEAIHHFLTMMYLPAPLTGITGIEKLPAAHAMTIDLEDGQTKTWRYWELAYQTDTKRSVDEWKREILPLFEESVKLRMISDVPVGAFLSGGVDSAATVAMMSRFSDHPVKTFSIGWKGQDSELPDAQIIADRFGTDHHPIVLEPDIVHLLPQLVATYDQPFADPSLVAMYLLARETRKHVTVSLSGDGGDENFAGYVRYPILALSERLARLPKFMRAFLMQGNRAAFSLFPSTQFYRGNRFLSTLDQPWPQRYLQYLSFFTEEEKRSLYAGKSSFPPTDQWYAQRTETSRTHAHDMLHKAMSMDGDTYLPDDLMPKVDLGAMAHGLEVRSPLLDHQLLELTAQLPADLQIHKGTRKWIFREILKDILPADTLQKKKRGFRLPLDRWFRTELRSFVRGRLLDAESGLNQFFERSALEKFINRYETTKIDYSDHIWALLLLDEWIRQQ